MLVIEHAATIAKGECHIDESVYNAMDALVAQESRQRLANSSVLFIVTLVA